MAPRCLLLLLIVLLCHSGRAQSHVTLEQYHYVRKTTPYTYMPILHYQTSRNWYGEARYNYEDQETFSLFLGKAFTRDKSLSYSFIPILGGSAGRFSGVSAGLNIDLGYDKFFFSAQSQYSVSTGKLHDRFLYSWSELGYQTLKWLYAGVSLQHTNDYLSGRSFEPGVLLEFSFNKISIPVYAFNPFNEERYIIIGFNIEWKRQKKLNAER